MKCILDGKIVMIQCKNYEKVMSKNHDCSKCCFEKKRYGGHCDYEFQIGCSDCYFKDVK